MRRLRGVAWRRAFAFSLLRHGGRAGDVTLNNVRGLPLLNDTVRTARQKSAPKLHSQIRNRKTAAKSHAAAPPTFRPFTAREELCQATTARRIRPPTQCQLCTVESVCAPAICKQSLHPAPTRSPRRPERPPHIANRVNAAVCSSSTSTLDRPLSRTPSVVAAICSTPPERRMTRCTALATPTRHIRSHGRCAMLHCSRKLP